MDKFLLIAQDIFLLDHMFYLVKPCKNLVLSGVGHICVVDDKITNEQDI